MIFTITIILLRPLAPTAIIIDAYCVVLDGRFPRRYWLEPHVYILVIIVVKRRCRHGGRVHHGEGWRRTVIPTCQQVCLQEWPKRTISQRGRFRYKKIKEENRIHEDGIDIAANGI